MFKGNPTAEREVFTLRTFRTLKDTSVAPLEEPLKILGGVIQYLKVEPFVEAKML